MSWLSEWLDNRAQRRVRRLYKEVLVCHDDTRGLAAHFARSLPRYGERPSVHPSGVYELHHFMIPDGSPIPWDGLEPGKRLDAAASCLGAVSFWVDNFESGKQFWVYVVEKPGKDTASETATTTKARWQSQERDKRVEWLGRPLAEDFESLVDEHTSPVTGMVDRDQALRLMTDAYKIGRHDEAAARERDDGDGCRS